MLVTELIRRGARDHRDRIALRFGEQALTFAEVDSLSEPDRHPVRRQARSRSAEPGRDPARQRSGDDPARLRLREGAADPGPGQRPAVASRAVADDRRGEREYSRPRSEPFRARPSACGRNARPVALFARRRRRFGPSRARARRIGWAARFGSRAGGRRTRALHVRHDRLAEDGPPQPGDLLGGRSQRARQSGRPEARRHGPPRRFADPRQRRLHHALLAARRSAPESCPASIPLPTSPRSSDGGRRPCAWCRP